MATADLTAPPRVVRWRRAALVLTALGCLCHFGGGRLFQLENVESLPLVVVINAIMFGPFLCTALFAIWYLFRGPSRWYARVGHLAAAGAVAAGVVALAHPSIRFFTAI